MSELVQTFLRHVDATEVSAAIEEWEKGEGKNILKRIKALSSEVALMEKKISALMDLITEEELRDLTKKKIIETQHELNERKALLQSYKYSAAARNVQSDVDHVRGVIEAGLEAYDLWDETKLRQLANIFIERIEVAHFGEIKIYWKSGLITEISPSPPDPGNPHRRKRGVGANSNTLGTAKKHNTHSLRFEWVYFLSN